MCEIKHEIEFGNSMIMVVVTDFDYSKGCSARIRQDPNDSHPAEDAELEVIEYHVENYRDQKIHFSVNQLDQIFEAFKDEIEEAVWSEIED